MIRHARHEDIPAIRRLMEAEPGFWQPSWSNDTLARGIDSAAGLAFIWEDSGEITGFICAHYLGFRAYLSELIVSKESRGRGIGKALFEHVQNSLAQQDCATLIADVWREAVPFYNSLGWEPPDAILLRRKINIKAA